MEVTARADARVFDVDGIDALIGALRDSGRTVIGPTVRSGSIAFDEVGSAADLPRGLRDDQEAGTFRLVPRSDGALFGHNAGHDSLKRFLFPPRVPVWHAGAGEQPQAPATEPPRYAFLGVRACDLAAVEVQDRVFMGDAWVEPDYAARRDGALFVAVNCGQSGGTCFCTSMGSGPRAESGYDLALTELIAGGHRFLAEPGTERGAALLASLPTRPATPGDERQAAAAVEHAAATMGRTLDTTDIRDLLMGNLEHPRWDDAAERCLSCTNCTLVCPTCFCATVEDSTDLAGSEASRDRVWDSCFSLDHSYVHGGPVRRSGRSRYRQWTTHKLATWIDQFGTSGCVGCGRCITWCPVAIDITEEVAAIRAADMRDADHS